MWALAGLAAGLGLVTYAVGQAGSFAITQRTDPTRATLDRNRYIGFGVLLAGGLAIAALGKPSTTRAILGAGVAAGGLMGLGGTELSLALGRIVDKTDAPAVLTPPQTTKGLYDQQFAAVYGGGQQQFFSAVYEGGVQRLGSGNISNMGATFTGGEQQFAGASGYDYFAG
jgi:hypothetical protein